ncbi:hypothetical protein AVEN_198602-1, partial [Araneus ventricosus]
QGSHIFRGPFSPSYNNVGFSLFCGSGDYTCPLVTTCLAKSIRTPEKEMGSIFFLVKATLTYLISPEDAWCNINILGEVSFLEDFRETDPYCVSLGGKQKTPASSPTAKIVLLP